MDMISGDISKTDASFEAQTLYRGYVKFRDYLKDAGYKLDSSDNSKEYLMVGKKQPIVSSSMIKCVMVPEITGRNTCSEETLEYLSGSSEY